MTAKKRRKTGKSQAAGHAQQPNDPGPARGPATPRRIAPLPSLPEASEVVEDEPRPALRLAGERQIGGAPVGGLLGKHSLREPDRRSRRPGIRMPEVHAPREVLGDAARLFELARHNRAEDVRRLIANGADPDHSDDPGNVHHEAVSFMCRNEDIGEDTPDGIRFGRTACHMAAVRGHDAVVRELISGGCDVNLVDHAGKTPLMRASRAGFLETVRLLVQAGAQVNARDLRGSTALIRAADSGHAEVVSFLIDAGAVINAVDCAGRSALLLAAKGAHAETVHELLSARADVRLRDVTGDDALSAAVQAVVPEDPNTPSPFHVVREERLHPVVSMLLAAGARNEPDAAGVRPSERAEELGHHQVAELLRQQS